MTVATDPAPKAPSRWLDRARSKMLSYLVTGTSPEKAALAVALGITCGAFPIFGLTTLITFLAGLALRANPVLVQVFNHLMYPVYFPIAGAFIVAGTWLFGGSDAVDLSSTGLRTIFLAGWSEVVRQLGTVLLHAALVWLAFAPVAILGLTCMLRPWMRRLAATAQAAN